MYARPSTTVRPARRSRRAGPRAASVGRRTSGATEWRTSSRGLPAAPAGLGIHPRESRPTILPITARAIVLSATGRSPRRPSRKTVTRFGNRENLRTSPLRDVHGAKTVACAEIAEENRERAASRSGSVAVGSFEHAGPAPAPTIARADLTICCCAMLSAPTRSSASTGAPTVSGSPAPPAASFRRGGAHPARASARERCSRRRKAPGASVKLLIITSTPLCPRGLWMPSPDRRPGEPYFSPSVVTYRRPITLTSVDLPAPFFADERGSRRRARRISASSAHTPEADFETRPPL